MWAPLPTRLLELGLWEPHATQRQISIAQFAAPGAPPPQPLLCVVLICMLEPEQRRRMACPAWHRPQTPPGSPWLAWEVATF